MTQFFWFLVRILVKVFCIERVGDFISNLLCDNLSYYPRNAELLEKYYKTHKHPEEDTVWEMDERLGLIVPVIRPYSSFSGGSLAGEYLWKLIKDDVESRPDPMVYQAYYNSILSEKEFNDYHLYVTNTEPRYEKFCPESSQDANALLVYSIALEQGRDVECNYQKAFKTLYRACEQGNPIAQYKMAMYYKFGLGGIEPNPKLSIFWLEKAAENGVICAMFEIADYYNKGEERDKVRYVFWLYKAAHAGNPQAQKDLAYMYIKGTLLAQDYDEAADWLDKASEPHMIPQAEGKVHASIKSYLKAHLNQPEIFARYRAFLDMNCGFAPMDRINFSNDSDIREREHPITPSSVEALEEELWILELLTSTGAYYDEYNTYKYEVISCLIDGEKPYFKQMVNLAFTNLLNTMAGKGARVAPNSAQADSAELNARFNLSKISNASYMSEIAQSNAYAKVAANDLGNVELDEDWDADSDEQLQHLLEEHQDLSFNQLEQKALSGDINAQIVIGLRYKEGLGIQISPVKAGEWLVDASNQGSKLARYAFTKFCLDQALIEPNFEYKIILLKYAAEHNNLDAKYLLGLLYMTSNNLSSSSTDSDKVEFNQAAIEADGEGELAQVANEIKSQSGSKYKKAIYWLKQAAKQNHAQAQYLLGEIYSNCKDVEPNHKLSLLYFSQAAQNKVTKAMFELAKHFARGWGIEQDYDKAEYWYKQASKAGYFQSLIQLAWLYYGKLQNYQLAYKCFNQALEHTEQAAMAYYGLGVLYKYGKGVEQDSKQAFELFNQAAMLNNDWAFYEISQAYYKGSGVEQNTALAMEYLLKGAHSNDSKAQYALGYKLLKGIDLEQDIAQAYVWISKAAEDGNASAQNMLGIMYERGQGVAQDYGKAREWFSKAVDQNHAGAQCGLAWLHQHGLGVPRDYSISFSLFSMAAEQGNDSALHSLGWIYQHGLGVEIDYAKALELYEQSVAKGNASAMCSLAFMYQKGLGCEVDHDKAIELFNKAAERGNVSALNCLGWMYQKGRGLPKNYAKALELYQKAAAYNHPGAMTCLGWMHANGLGVNVDHGLAFDYYQKAASLGYANAMFYLGQYYERGCMGVVEQDMAKALELYQQAASYNNQHAIERLNILAQSQGYVGKIR